MNVALSALAVLTAGLLASSGTADSQLLAQSSLRTWWVPRGFTAAEHTATGPARQALATFSDLVGDADGGLAPDISAVRVDHDAGGTIVVTIAYANRPCAGPGDGVYVYFDVDRNPATGGPAGGVEYVLILNGASKEVGATRWNGVAREEVYLPSLRATCDSSASSESISISRLDIGVSTGFVFSVGTEFTAADGSAFYDLAGWNERWYYQLSAPPPPSTSAKTYKDASSLPARIRYVGESIKHVRVGESLYATMKKLGPPRAVAAACWSKYDWSSVVESAGIDTPWGELSGFWLPLQPRWLHLAPKRCTDIQALIDTRVPNGHRAYALSTALHERIRAEGLRNEARTECYAVQLVYEFARELGFVHPRALHLEQLAVRKSRSAAPRRYRDPVRCRDGGKWDLYPTIRNLS